MREETWFDKFTQSNPKRGEVFVPSRFLQPTRQHVLRQRGLSWDSSPREEIDDFEMAILPFQISRQPNVAFEDRSLEGQIAFRKLLIDILDVTSKNLLFRLKSIREMRKWMANDARTAAKWAGDEGFEYTFSYWTEQLDVDEGYMRRKLGAFLDRWQNDAERELAFNSTIS